VSNVLGSRIGRIAALAGLNLLLVAGGWLALVSPQRHHAAAAAQQVQSVQDEIGKLSTVATPPPGVRKVPVIHTASLYKLAQAMPTTPDEPDLLLAVDQLAQASGVRVTTLSPSTPAQQNGYTVLPISLAVSGRYAQITRFLHRLRTLVSVRHGALQASGRLFSVQSLGLAPGPSGPGLVATVTVDAYVFGGASPAPAAADTSATSTTGTSSTSTTTTTG
jgi:hypothetical protein